MLTLEQLNRLQIHELSPRAKKDRQYRIVKRVVTDGKWNDPVKGSYAFGSERDFSAYILLRTYKWKRGL